MGVLGLVLGLCWHLWVIASGQTMCPRPEEISPCVCQEDQANYAADVDCSAVGYADQLSDIFNVRKPWKPEMDGKLCIKKVHIHVEEHQRGSKNFINKHV
jgi:hypothetical protein